jgi:hypothetical protein
MDFLKATHDASNKIEFSCLNVNLVVPAIHASQILVKAGQRFFICEQ